MTITAAIRLYLKALEARGYSPRTLDSYGPHLETFRAWGETRQLTSCQDLGVEVLRSYQGEIAGRVSSSRRPLSLHTQAGLLSVVKGFCRFLAERGIVLVDHGKGLELPRIRRHGPPYGLPTPAEIARILQVPDIRTLLGVRDRAVLEVLYSTGIRNAELRVLRTFDVDLTEGTLGVFQGKGRKDRVVPLGRQARRWVEEYLTRVRPVWVGRTSTSTLFLSNEGNPLDFSNLNKMVRKAARAARVTKRVTVHTFRHACATHMLQNGADIRYIQKLLGHRSLLSTAVYTHLEIRDLKRVHRRCHPRAKRPGRVEESSRGE